MPDVHCLVSNSLGTDVPETVISLYSTQSIEHLTSFSREYLKSIKQIV